MSTLKISLFGQLRISYRDLLWQGPDGSKTRELLCYLLIRPQKRFSREHLAGLFWADNCGAQSKKYLRQSLWQLQSATGSHLGIRNPSLLLTGHEFVQINPALELCVDIGTFEQTYACLQSQKEMNEDCVHALNEAVDLYQGDLLEGHYQDWCLYERERFQNMYLIMLDRLVEHGEVIRDYQTGINRANQILRYDSLRERTHQQLMRLLYLSGDRAGALHQYDRCVEILKRELGVGPSKATVAVYDQIRRDQYDSSSRDGTQTQTIAESSATFPSLLKHLKQMQATLAALQQELQNEIHLVERSLPKDQS